MRLFELFDNPLQYELTNKLTRNQGGGDDYVYTFRVEDYLYQVYVNVYPVYRYLEFSNFEGFDTPKEFPSEFEGVKDKYILSVDFSQFDYSERTIPFRGTIPWAKGDARDGREGTGNELQVFATITKIVKEVVAKYSNNIGIIEFGSKTDDPNRKRLYMTLMRRNGITGKTIEIKYPSESGPSQDRVFIVL